VIKVRIRDVMSTNVITTRPETSLREVARMLIANRISGLPVTEDHRLLGVVSESDIVMKIEGPDAPEEGQLSRLLRRSRRRHLEAVTAAEAMTSPCVTIEPWVSIWAAASLMMEHEVNRLPVIADGEVIGIVSRADIVRAFARSDAEVRREIREEILRAFEISPDAVEVDVRGGEVTLRGDVAQLEVEALPRAVRRVVGVLDVHSELRAQEPALS
jgi:CBS-domain-containing membrane protein